MKGLLIVAVLFLYLLQSVVSQGCTYNYTIQPPAELICDPIGGPIYLQCATAPHDTTFKWYYNNSLTVTVITSSGNGYTVIRNFGSRLRFTISNNTVGSYWCQGTADNGNGQQLRNSSISYVHYNESLLCTSQYSDTSQRTVIECADILNTTDTILSTTTQSITTSSASTVDNDMHSTIYSSTSVTESYSTTSVTESYSTTSVTEFSIMTSTSYITSTTPNPTPSTTTAPTVTDSLTLIIALSAVCALLAIIACVIIIAIVILCMLTSKQRKANISSYKEQTSNTSGNEHTTQERVNAQPKFEDNIETCYESPPTHTNASVAISGNGNIDIPRGISFSNPVYALSNGIIPKEATINEQQPVVSINKESSNSMQQTQRPYYAKPDLNKKRSQSNASEMSPVSPTNTTTIDAATAPPIPPQLFYEQITNTYDMPSDFAPEHSYEYAPASYILPRLIAPSKGALYDNVPPTEDVPAMTDVPQYETPCTQNKIKEGAYDDPWSALPTGVKRTKSRGSTKSHSANPTQSVSPCNNLFDDPTYDSPSHNRSPPAVPLPVNDDAFGYAIVN